jgi:peptidoglycan/xylan/chitin deacetylase (PgdA/CDA1 family)
VTGLLLPPDDDGRTDGRRYRYRPAAARPTGSWPGGRQLAVYVALGVEDYRLGDGESEDLLPEVPHPDRVNTAWRDYGNRVGAFRVLDGLAECGIPPTLLLNTVLYESAPDVPAAARAAGAEMVAHGHSNSDSLAALAPGQELPYLREVADRIAAAEGTPPGGWSSPWLTHTAETPDLLAAAGYRYLLDLRPDDQPVWMQTASTPLLAIPYALELNDSTTMIGRQVSPRDFADMIVDEFDELRETAGEQPVVMSVVLHSFISGMPFRFRAVRRALEHLAGFAGDVWFTTPAGIDRAFRELAPPPTPR